MGRVIRTVPFFNCCWQYTCHVRESRHTGYKVGSPQALPLTQEPLNVWTLITLDCRFDRRSFWKAFFYSKLPLISIAQA